MKWHPYQRSHKGTHIATDRLLVVHRNAWAGWYGAPYRWGDGRVISALTASLGPGLIDMNNLGDPYQATERALQIAEKHYHIPRLIDPEDLLVEPDANSLATYLSYFEQRVRVRHIYLLFFERVIPSNMCELDISMVIGE